MVPCQGVASAFELVGQAQAAHAVAKTVANQHTQNVVETAHVSGCAQGFDQHGGMIDGQDRDAMRLACYKNLSALDLKAHNPAVQPLSRAEQIR